MLPHRRRLRPVAGLVLCALLVTTAACSSGSTGKTAAAAAATAPDGTPRTGACHRLTVKDTSAASSEKAAVACSAAHTAQTYAVGTFPATLSSAAYDARGLGRYVYRTCGPALTSFLGSDDSEVLRSRLSWVWFRPSKQAWSAGARWYRCDVVGGPATATSYADLPATAKNLLGGAPADAWMQCATGADVTKRPVPCTAKHDWRAVTTIKLGQPKDPYPGDRLVQIRSQQYCSDSIGAWLNYPVTDYRYATTIYHQAEWSAGNRRSVCWARTTS